jgi:hypothetical protein
MRTTIRLDDALLTEAKQLAARTGRTLTAVIEDALRQMLSRTPVPGPRRRFVMPTYGRGGVRPGVDLDDTAGLLDLMDGTT